jgi:activating signal cointegrator complex subunit 3
VLLFYAFPASSRLTAFDIISYAASEENPKQFLGCDESYVEAVAERISDEALRHTILFGIGLHHAGISSQDRGIVEEMFLKGEIQILVATATLAWGVNCEFIHGLVVVACSPRLKVVSQLHFFVSSRDAVPAHLVIVKGTEFFDGKSSRYVDYPLTDVLQMIGRAGRPGFDTSAKAVVMAMEDKVNFYMKVSKNVLS